MSVQARVASKLRRTLKRHPETFVLCTYPGSRNGVLRHLNPDDRGRVIFVNRIDVAEAKRPLEEIRPPSLDSHEPTG